MRFYDVLSLAGWIAALSAIGAGAAVAQTGLDADWARRQELQQLQAVAEHNRQIRMADAASVGPAETGLGRADGAFEVGDRSGSVQLNREGGFRAAPPAEAFGPQAFGPAIAFASDDPDAFRPAGLDRDAGFAATSNRDIWVEGDGYSDRLRVTTRGALRRADGAPLPPTARDLAALDVDGYDVRYTRGFTAARGRTASGLEVSLTPHAGFGVGDRGGSAEAGATLRIGQGLDKMVKDGSETFGQRARWYLYAAGSGRAVGYNFARTRDGDYARSGYSHDSGSFLGDASVGVAWRRGAVHSSFGVVYREVEAEGLRGEGIDTDVSEGLVAFQLSLKPEW